MKCPWYNEETLPFTLKTCETLEGAVSDFLNIFLKLTECWRKMECVGDIDLQSVRSSTYQEMCGRGKYKTACLPSCPAFERTLCDC